MFIKMKVNQEQYNARSSDDYFNEKCDKLSTNLCKSGEEIVFSNLTGKFSLILYRMKSF